MSGLAEVGGGAITIGCGLVVTGVLRLTGAMGIMRSTTRAFMVGSTGGMGTDNSQALVISCKPRFGAAFLICPTRQWDNAFEATKRFHEVVHQLGLEEVYPRPKPGT